MSFLLDRTQMSWAQQYALVNHNYDLKCNFADFCFVTVTVVNVNEQSLLFLCYLEQEIHVYLL